MKLSPVRFPETSFFSTALIKLIKDWLSHIDKGNIVGAILFDLKKAFDIVDHEMLLQKLALYGVRGTSLRWFESYLSKAR